MASFLRVLFCASALLACFGGARADIVNFDDLPDIGLIPVDYQGFQWSPAGYIDQGSYQTIFLNTYGFPSSPNAAFNGFGDVTVSLPGGVFVFNGADFSGFAILDAALPDFTAATVTVNGFLGGNPVGSLTMDLPTNEFEFLAADMTVDTLTFQADVPLRVWLMDDFRFTSVPEPGSLLLLLSGLAVAGLRWARRRRL